MTETLGAAAIDLETDQTALDKGFAEAKRKADKAGKDSGTSFSQGVKKAALPAAAVFGAVLLGAKKAKDAASDVNEAQAAVGETFKGSSDQIVEWSKNTEDAFSQVQFLSAAKTFAGFGKAADLTGNQLNTFSKDLIDAAGDLASFHNVPIEQALEDMRSGLSGETEPLRKYNILLNEAALQQEATRMGLVKHGETLTEQQKVLARQHFILNNLGAANNDYARTADGVANTERRQAANAEDLTANMGQGLLPAYQVLQSILLQVTTVMGKHTTATKIVVGVVAALAAGLLVLNGALKVYELFTNKATIATIKWTIALLANPVFLIVAGVIALVAAIILLWKRSNTFRRIVTRSWEAVKAAAMATWEWIKTNWPHLFALLTLGMSEVAGLIIRHWDTIRDKTKAILDRLREIVSNTFDRIKGFIDDKLVSPLETAVGWIKDLIGFAKDLVGWIRKIHFPDVPDWVPIIGDGVVGANMGAAAGNASISPKLWDDISLGNSMGLGVSSGYRAGSVTSTGNPSLHGVFPSRAVDMAGPESAMRRFFLTEVARGPSSGLAEIIHSPYWWHPGVGITRIPGSAGTVLADHYNHVHVGTYDDGGWLQPGVTLAMNNTGRSERILGPRDGAGVTFVLPRFVGNKRDLMNDMRDAVEQHRRSNGGADPW